MSKKMWCVSLNCVSLYMYKWTDADRAQKHGMDEFISSNPCNFDHASLFEMVQRLTLDHRLNDSYSCLASIFFGLQQFKRDNLLQNKIFLYLYVKLFSPLQSPFNNYKYILDFLGWDSFTYQRKKIQREEVISRGRSNPPASVSELPPFQLLHEKYSQEGNRVWHLLVGNL